jgi:hypothetical protein
MRATSYRGSLLALVAFAGCWTRDRAPLVPSSAPPSLTASAAEKPMVAARQPAITAKSSAVRRQSAGPVEVTIAWQIDNPADEPLYVLDAQPLEFRSSVQIILDHSSNGGVWQGRPNVIPGFAIVMIPAHHSAQFSKTYLLAVPPDHRQVTVIGRFGYSFTQPSPDWEAQKNWKQVAAWQTIVDSAPVTVPIT